METPLVSIIIPTFNRAHLIGETLDSIMAQTYTNWECIIVDDGSTDNTSEIVGGYIEKDSRFQYHHRPKDRLPGANACRNYGFENSHGSYINWLDSDDVFLPSKLDSQIKVFEQNPDINFTICQTDIFDKVKNQNLGLRSENILSDFPLDDYITFKIFWGIQSPLWRREVIEEFSFNEQLQQSQEYDFHIRTLQRYPGYVADNKVLTTIIAHDSNMSNSRVDQTDKFESNIRVRFNTIANFHNVLKDDTLKYLANYIFDWYKVMLRKRDWKKAIICLKYFFKLGEIKTKIRLLTFSQLVCYTLALAFHFFTNKGTFLLKSNR